MGHKTEDKTSRSLLGLRRTQERREHAQLQTLTASVATVAVRLTLLRKLGALLAVVVLTREESKQSVLVAVLVASYAIVNHDWCSTVLG